MIRLWLRKFAQLVPMNFKKEIMKNKSNSDSKFLREMNPRKDRQINLEIKYLLDNLPKDYNISKDDAKRIIIDVYVSEAMEEGLGLIKKKKVSLFENKNTSNMTWDIDHVKPLLSFNYSSLKDEDFQKAWALENLKPVDSRYLTGNMLKGNKTLGEWKEIIKTERIKMKKESGEQMKKKIEKETEEKAEDKSEDKCDFDDELIDELVERFLDSDDFSEMVYDLNERYDHPDNYIDSISVAMHIAMDVIYECDQEMMAEMEAEEEAKEKDEKKVENKDLN